MPPNPSNKGPNLSPDDPSDRNTTPSSLCPSFPAPNPPPEPSNTDTTASYPAYKTASSTAKGANTENQNPPTKTAVPGPVSPMLYPPPLPFSAENTPQTRSLPASPNPRTEDVEILRYILEKLEVLLHEHETALALTAEKTWKLRREMEGPEDLLLGLRPTFLDPEYLARRELVLETAEDVLRGLRRGMGDVGPEGGLGEVEDLTDGTDDAEVGVLAEFFGFSWEGLEGDEEVD